MIRTWKTLTMYSLMAATTLTIAPPIFAQDNNDELKKSIDKLIKRIDALEQKPTDQEAIAKALRSELKKLENGTLADIKKSVQDTKADMVNLQLEQQRLKAQLENHRLLIEGLEKKILAGVPATPAVDKAFMDDLRGAMKAIQDSLARLGPTKERVSMSPSIPNGTPGLGRVLLANHYPDELLFIVNGVGHRLPANSTKLVENVPVGNLNYEVFSTRFGILERRVTMLAGGDTFNLTAR